MRCLGKLTRTIVGLTAYPDLPSFVSQLLRPRTVVNCLLGNTHIPLRRGKRENDLESVSLQAAGYLHCFVHYCHQQGVHTMRLRAVILVLLAVGLLLLALPAASARALKTLELDDSIKYGQMSTVFDGGVRGMSVTEVWDAVKIIHTRMLSFH